MGKIGRDGRDFRPLLASVLSDLENPSALQERVHPEDCSLVDHLWSDSLIPIHVLCSSSSITSSSLDSSDSESALSYHCINPIATPIPIHNLVRCMMYRSLHVESS